ncbi:ThiF family adenylyltransferase, partial [Vibrio parahaemolyticus]
MLELYHEVLQIDSIANLIMGDKDNWVLLTLFGSIDERKLIRYTTIKIPEHKNRLPDQFLSLSDKKVGLVGCGSVGSKVAASLCRSGVGNFLLIDEDIFFPDNIVRNDLDLN